MLVLAGVTYALVVLGAVVRANGAGLACPDWPLCFGEFVPRFDTRVALEWGHRALAGLVSVGLLAVSIALLRRRESRRFFAGRLALAWALLLGQALLGALTVWLRLAPWTVTLHLLGGNLFCLLLVWFALDVFDRRSSGQTPEAMTPPTRLICYLLAAMVALQVTLGGVVSSHAAGLACAAFPTCDGQHYAPTLSGLVGLHVLHRLAAAGLLLAFVFAVWPARRPPRVARAARIGVRLCLFQIVIGALNVLLRLPVEVTALHSAVATAIVLTAGVMLREALYAPAELRAPAGAASALGAR